MSAGIDVGGNSRPLKWLAEVVAIQAKRVTVVANKSFALAQHQHGHDVRPDGVFGRVKVFCQVGCGDALKHLAVGRFGSKARAFVVANGGGHEN